MELKMTDNPLKQYFRQPAIYLPLPSKGRFYPEGAIELPESGELPVYPMTAIDEITYKTPDALFNGTSVVDVIRSCVPSIKDPWYMPTFDLNTVLTAIRIASFGEEMDIVSTCPSCGTTADYTVDCHTLIDRTPDISKYDETVNIGDLKIHFRPLFYKEVNENNKMQFEEARLHQLINDDSVTPEKKVELLTQAFQNIAAFSIQTVGKSIESIETPESIVTEKDHIKDFLSNCESEVYERIKKHLFELKRLEDLEPLHIQCSECNHEYDQAFALDMSSFFERSS